MIFWVNGAIKRKNNHTHTHKDRNKDYLPYVLLLLFLQGKFNENLLQFLIAIVNNELFKTVILQNKNRQQFLKTKYHCLRLRWHGHIPHPKQHSIWMMPMKKSLFIWRTIRNRLGSFFLVVHLKENNIFPEDLLNTRNLMWINLIGMHCMFHP